MSRSNPHPELSDARLEQLLGVALGVPAEPTDLADRIVSHTALKVERLGNRRRVAGRIWPSLVELAAVLGLAVCAAWWVASREQSPTPPVPTLALDLPLDATLDARIDDQIALLGLQVDVVASKDLWNSGEGMDEALLPYELDALALDPMVF